MKQWIPFFIAALAFSISLLLMRPETRVPVVVAAADLPAGHRLVEGDLAVRDVPVSLAPEDAMDATGSLTGQTLRVPRTAGDALYAAHLGSESLELAPGERAVALHVGDSSGLAGLLKPGDRVGITVTFAGQTLGAEEPARSGSYGKVLAGGLRVLYISPDFTALDPLEASPPPGGGLAPAGAARQRQTEGVVVLAVPVEAQVIPYDFLAYGVASASRPVSLIDLLPALDQSRDVALSLSLEPDVAQAFTTSGVFLPDLVVAPGPSPTPDQTQVSYATTPTPAQPPAATPETVQP